MNPVNHPSLPVLGFTMGDPGGIGPEVTLRAIDYFSSAYPFIPVLFGSRALLEHPFLLKFVQHKRIVSYESGRLYEPHTLYFSDSYSNDSFEFNKASANNGDAAYHYISDATQAILEGHIDALVTAPICKESFQLAGIKCTGHTTLLQQLTKVKHVSMAFHTPTLNIVLATIHVALKDVASMITPSLLQVKLDHAIELVRLLGNQEGHIAIAGLNPHAGENGLFGSEEQAIISSFVSSVDLDQSMNVTGPYSADTLFYRANRGEFDCVLAMYHDQGLIPIKLNHFYDAVNVTLGLPFIRTSPDHGTAFDRAYRAYSSIDSMVASIRLACRFANSYG
ncbi:4-hydroxythreonine-4-phosphate dehydrogenase PdxA [bacterium]|nr:4-hydroxythreonine-4-phosphate dehydrogenase PdxA [bacterium]|tara:strand:- start:77 stop:1084 length:1008 start_codon:yes stop_codon:yes gene_type:complete